MTKELQTNNPSLSLTTLQTTFLKPVKSISDVLSDPFPCLGVLVVKVGETQIKAILVKILTDLISFFNVGKTMNANQVIQTVELIIDSYPMFKLSHFKLCFNRAKAGRYGKVYDRIDGQVIFEWLGLFEQEIEEDIIELRRKESQQAKEDSKDLSLILGNENIKVDFRQIGKEKPVEKPQIELDKKIQRWLRQFDEIQKKRPILKDNGETMSVSLVKRINKIMDSRDWLNYKLEQEQKVINYLKNR